MDLHPNAGLGDLLIEKFRHISSPISPPISKIYVNREMLIKHRGHPEEAEKTYVWLAKRLFPNANIVIKNSSFSERSPLLMPITKTRCLECFSDILSRPLNITKSPYIVIHTKVRNDYDHYQENVFNLLMKWLRENREKLLSKYQVVILGEREIENNVESRIHNIRSIYKPLIESLGRERVLDLTENQLYSNGNIEILERDIQIMNKADLNLFFGIGGPLNILKAIGGKSWFYWSPKLYQSINVVRQYGAIQDGDRFFHTIEELLLELEKFIV